MMTIFFVIRDIINLSRVNVVAEALDSNDVSFINCMLCDESCPAEISKSGCFYIDGKEFISRLDDYVISRNSVFVFDTFGPLVSPDVYRIYEWCLTTLKPILMIPHGTPLIFPTSYSNFNTSKVCDLVAFSSKLHFLSAKNFFGHPDTAHMVLGDPILSAASREKQRNPINHHLKIASFCRSRYPENLHFHSRNTSDTYDELSRTLLNLAEKKFDAIHEVPHPRHSGKVGRDCIASTVLTISSSSAIVALARGQSVILPDMHALGCDADHLLKAVPGRSFVYNQIPFIEISPMTTNELGTILGLECKIENMIERYRDVIRSKEKEKW